MGESYYFLVRKNSRSCMGGECQVRIDVLITAKGFLLEISLLDAGETLLFKR